MTFVRVASVTELSDPGQLLVEVEDRLVVLFRVNGELFAIDDICTHDGGPLSDGQLHDHEIACPRHGAKFDIRSGRALTMPATQATGAHDVRLEGDTVFVRLREPGDAPPQSAKIAASSVAPPTAAPSRPTPAPALAIAPSSFTTSAPAAAAPPAATVPSTDKPTATDKPSSNSSIANAPAADAAPVASSDAAAKNPSTEKPAATAEPVLTGPLNEDQCREALKSVVDPELFVNIVDLGLIYLVEVSPKDDGRNDVVVEMTMTSPACPAGPQLLHNSKEAIKRLESVDQVEVKLVMTPPWTPDRMTDEARDQLGIF